MFVRHTFCFTFCVFVFFLLFVRGLAPRAVRTQQAELSTADKKQLLEKGATMDRDVGMDTERVSGLGAGP